VKVDLLLFFQKIKYLGILVTQIMIENVDLLENN